MTLIHFLRHFAAIVSARDAAAVVILAAALGTAAYAHYCAPSALRRHRFALAAVALGAATLLLASRGVLASPVLFGVFLAVVAGFSLHTFTDKPTDSGRRLADPEPRRGSTVWIGAASILAGSFLLTDLGGYANSLMVWEPESMRGLVEAMKSGTSLPRFAALHLLWGRGLLSSGSDSLLFGSGTYALWQLVGVSFTTLRLTASVLSLACLPVAYRLGMRLGGASVAKATVVLFAVNPVLVFYGRYGVALSATLFAVLLLLLTCDRLLDPTEGRWWFGLTAAAAAFLATLGYSTGRIVAIAVVTLTLLWVAGSWRRLPRDSRLALVLMVMVLAGVWLVQAEFDTPRDFIGVRGEHLMLVTPQSGWVERVLGNEVDPERLSWRQRLIMTGRVVSERAPQLMTVLSYSIRPPGPPWAVLRGDPPALPLVQGPLLLLAIWGFVRALFLWRQGWPLLLAAATAAASLPLLLTTRVDIHRLSLASLPVIFWAALGVVAADRIAQACGVSSAPRRAVAAVLVLLFLADNSTFLFYSQKPAKSQLAMGILSEIESISGPIVLGVAGNHLSAGEIQLALIERQRLDHDVKWEFLSNDTVAGLIEKGGIDDRAVALVQDKLHREVVILAPREPFEAAIQRLREGGAAVWSLGGATSGWWQIDGFADENRGLSDGSVFHTTLEPELNELPRVYR